MINKWRTRGFNLDAVGKYKDAETTIRDGQGWIHDGYYCKHDACEACPYWVLDMDGEMACYGDMYYKCQYEE